MRPPAPHRKNLLKSPCLKIMTRKKFIASRLSKMTLSGRPGVAAGKTGKATGVQVSEWHKWK
jgi:hypothetical protein